MQLCESWKLISKGAEATLYLGSWYGFKAIKKVRHPKRYRYYELDKHIRITRTRREARLLIFAKKCNVLVPYVYHVDLDECSIIMEYISGKLLRDYIYEKEEEGDYETICKLLRMAGEYLANLHENRILHGDYTTSNIIVHDKTGNLFVIDFGLGGLSSGDIEDFATDLRVFTRGLECAHWEHYDEYLRIFLEGYHTFSKGDETIKRLREIALRGRYVRERRLKKVLSYL